MSKIKKLDELINIRKHLKNENKKVVFTNGCFDILHAGHIDYLLKAKQMGDVLIVGMNSDKSVRNIKGKSRPIINENERSLILSNLLPVDYVVLFDDDTPHKLITALLPDVLIKGADWNINEIVGKDIVEKNGGEVKTIKFEIDQSTSKIIEKISNPGSKHS
ncbi:MAG: D-glycero-beta-D-manno-heptose 1-phosphate adenylyltransferase [Ignavibacteria bacterium]|jgi:rfaE bifunctional protein nucleotidyltransferase chain/domain